MLAIPQLLRDAIEEGVIRPSSFPGIYWTPSILRQHPPRDADAVELRALMANSDFFIGTYDRLKDLKDAARTFDPVNWSRTDIHHIVENHHLQYLARVTKVDDVTYYKAEPCVVFVRSHHRLALDNAVTDAERVIFEVRKFNFVEEFRAANRGKLARLDRAAKTSLKNGWLKAEAAKRKIPRLGLQERVRDTLLELYDFIYQEADLRPLKLVARAVLRSMPL